MGDLEAGLWNSFCSRGRTLRRRPPRLCWGCDKTASRAPRSPISTMANTPCQTTTGTMTTVLEPRIQTCGLTVGGTLQNGDHTINWKYLLPISRKSRNIFIYFLAVKTFFFGLMASHVLGSKLIMASGLVDAETLPPFVIKANKSVMP